MQSARFGASVSGNVREFPPRLSDKRAVCGAITGALLAAPLPSRCACGMLANTFGSRPGVPLRASRDLSSTAPEPHLMSSDSLKELIEYLAKALVDHPEQVEVAEIAGEQTVVLELRVAKEDLGKVIGKQGRTVKAMRAILSAASSKLRKRADLEILE